MPFTKRLLIICYNILQLKQKKKPPSYTLPALAKDLFDFHSPLFSPSNFGGIFDK